MKLLITGGHITPALAFIDYALESKKLKPHHIVFVGRKYASPKERDHSFEYKEIQDRKIKFIHLIAGRFTRAISFQSLKNLFLVPVGFWRAWQTLSKEKPYAVLSFGGYIALPIACIAALRRIPVFTHEQTIVPGITNRFISRFATRIFVSFPETKKYFPKQKVIVTGNPVRKHVFNVEKAAFTLNKTRPVIYVTGGSTGSHQINIRIEKLLPELLQDYIVIHQTGNMKEFKDYDRLSQYKDSLEADLRKYYLLKPHFSTEEIGHIYKLADLVISRSGANTVFELIALKKPAILIPLPWAAKKEQEMHAKLFHKAGAGEVFHEREKLEKLHDQISMILMNTSDYISHFDKLEHLYNPNAAELIAKYVLR